MKTRILLLVFALPLCAYAQTKIDKSFPIQADQNLVLDFDYPQLIKVSTWDKQEVSIKGVASINRGENDDAFQLNTTTRNGALVITSSIKDMNKLPKRMLIKHGEEEYYFKTDNHNDPMVQQLMAEKGKNYRYINNSVIVEIHLEIFIPKNKITTIDAKYGMVELLACQAPLTVNAPFGGVDVTVPTQGLKSLSARTKFGEIFSNLSQKPIGSDFPDNFDNWTVVRYELGTGNAWAIESQFGKVYLRKQ
jgi:hypothetical protein